MTRRRAERAPRASAPLPPAAVAASVGVGRPGRVHSVERAASVRDGRAHALVPRALRGAPRSVVRERALHTEVLFLVDRSGSMYTASSDPTDICGAAAEGLIALQRRSGGGRAAVVPWGSSAPAGMVAGPLDVRRDTKLLSTALRVHTSLGGTDTAAALRRAGDVIGSGGAPAASTTVVFLLTDGCDDVGPDIRAAVAALPAGSVHALIIDRGGALSARAEAAWNSIGLGSFVRLDHLDVRGMTNQLVAAYANALGLQDTPL